MLEGLGEPEVLAPLGTASVDDICTSALSASVEGDARDDVALVAVRNRG